MKFPSVKHEGFAALSNSGEDEPWWRDFEKYKLVSQDPDIERLKRALDELPETMRFRPRMPTRYSIGITGAGEHDKGRSPYSVARAHFGRGNTPEENAKWKGFGEQENHFDPGKVYFFLTQCLVGTLPTNLRILAMFFLFKDEDEDPHETQENKVDAETLISYMFEGRENNQGRRLWQDSEDIDIDTPFYVEVVRETGKPVLILVNIAGIHFWFEQEMPTPSLPAPVPAVFLEEVEDFQTPTKDNRDWKTDVAKLMELLRSLSAGPSPTAPTANDWLTFVRKKGLVSPKPSWVNSGVHLWNRDPAKRGGATRRNPLTQLSVITMRRDWFSGSSRTEYAAAVKDGGKYHIVVLTDDCKTATRFVQKFKEILKEGLGTTPKFGREVCWNVVQRNEGLVWVRWVAQNANKVLKMINGRRKPKGEVVYSKMILGFFIEQQLAKRGVWRFKEYYDEGLSDENYEKKLVWRKKATDISTNLGWLVCPHCAKAGIPKVVAVQRCVKAECEDHFGVWFKLPKYEGPVTTLGW